MLQNEGKSEAALNCYEKALRQKPDYVEALSNLGILRAEEGRIGEALEYYNLAVTHAPECQKGPLCKEPRAAGPWGVSRGLEAV